MHDAAAVCEVHPIADPRERTKKQALAGDVPSPINPPSGCVFHTRCPIAEDRCRREVPLLRDLGTDGDEQLVACHLAE